MRCTLYAFSVWAIGKKGEGRDRPSDFNPKPLIASDQKINVNGHACTMYISVSPKHFAASKAINSRGNISFIATLNKLSLGVGGGGIKFQQVPNYSTH